MPPALPPDTRIYAIGDIHGCDQMLTSLLDQILAYEQLAAPVSHTALVFLGDYVDRGPDSKRVIEILTAELPPPFETVCLKGNHEEMLLMALEDDAALNMWLLNGGRETLLSYGVREVEIDDLPAMAKDRIGDAIPAEHLDFLRSLELGYQCGDYFFAHAGVNPAVPLDAQDEEDLIWIRRPFLLSDKDFGKVIVHGHSPTREPKIRPNRIAIDTGAVYGNKLTALVLEGDKQDFLSVDANSG